MKHKYINMSNSQTLETWNDPLESDLVKFMNSCEKIHPDWKNMHVPFKQEQQNASPETPGTQETLDTWDDWCKWEPELCGSDLKPEICPSQRELAAYANHA